jgi:hypothetical protein
VAGFCVHDNEFSASINKDISVSDEQQFQFSGKTLQY